MLTRSLLVLLSLLACSASGGTPQPATALPAPAHVQPAPTASAATGDTNGTAGGANGTKTEVRRPDVRSTSPNDCAARTVAALKAKDALTLASLAHPTLGVRFTPFAFPSQDDVVLSASDLRGAFADEKLRDWGRLGESDERFRATFEQYFSRFVYDADFARLNPAPSDTQDAFEARSWNLDELRKALRVAYPHGQVFEYRWPSADPASASDWRVLRLVCQEHGDEYFLVGVIHSEWTP